LLSTAAVGVGPWFVPCLLVGMRERSERSTDSSGRRTCAPRRPAPPTAPTRLSVWALFGGGIALCIGIVSLLTFEFYLEEGEELSSEAFSDLFDLVVSGAFLGLVAGVVYRLAS